MDTNKKTWEESVLWLREQPDQQELVYACYYDDPIENAAERYYKSDEWISLRNYLTFPPGSVLDIGAGRGVTSYAFAKDGWKVSALEPDKSNIVGRGAIKELFNKTGFSINLYSQWGENLPFADNTFDCVYARQVLHHAKDLKQLCNEIGRVLKPGGMFIASREHVISKQEDLEIFLQKHPLHKYYGGENAYLLKEYKNAILKAGIHLKYTLSPLETPINLFPMNYNELKKMISKKIFWPYPSLLPIFLIKGISKIMNTPGRLYTFIGNKN